MKDLKCCTIIGTLFTLTAGTLAHFLYNWSGNNPLVGFFTPVNESVWEHMKLLFFPMLLYSLFMILRFRKKYPYILSALCFGMIAGIFLIPLLYYAYTCLLGRNLFLLDIGIFLLSAAAAFRISYKLTLSCRLKACTVLLCILVCLLLVCFLRFSYYAPDSFIFQDPAKQS